MARRTEDVGGMPLWRLYARWHAAAGGLARDRAARARTVVMASLLLAVLLYAHAALTASHWGRCPAPQRAGLVPLAVFALAGGAAAGTGRLAARPLFARRVPWRAYAYGPRAALGACAATAGGLLLGGWAAVQAASLLDACGLPPAPAAPLAGAVLAGAALGTSGPVLGHALGAARSAHLWPAHLWPARRADRLDLAAFADIARPARRRRRPATRLGALTAAQLAAAGPGRRALGIGGAFALLGFAALVPTEARGASAVLLGLAVVLVGEALTVPVLLLDARFARAGRGLVAVVPAMLAPVLAAAGLAAPASLALAGAGPTLAVLPLAVLAAAWRFAARLATAGAWPAATKRALTITAAAYCGYLLVGAYAGLLLLALPLYDARLARRRLGLARRRWAGTAGAVP